MKRPPEFLWQLLALAAAAALPLLALLIWGAYRNVEEAHTEAEQSVRVRAAQVAQQASDTVTRAQRFLEFLSDRAELVALDGPRCDALLASMVTVDPMWANIGVVALDGRRVCSSIYGPGPVPQSYAAFPWFQHAVSEEGFTISKPFVGPSEQVPVAVASLPLRNRGGERIGLVGVSLDRSQWVAQWKRMQFPPGSVVALVERDGTVLARMPETEEWLRPGAVDALRDAGHTTRLPGADGDGIERVVAVAEVPGRQWSAVAGIPTGQIASRSRAALLRNLLAGGAALLLAVIVALLIARRLAQPVAMLSRTARAVASGQRQARTPQLRGGVFGEVASEFNRMLDVQEQTEAQLRESERRYRDMLDSVELFSLMTDLDGRLTYCNDHFVRRTGHAREELLGTDGLRCLFSPQHDDERLRLLQALQRGELPRRVETTVLARGGERLAVLWNTSMLRSVEGDIVGAACIGEDVTARREAELGAARLSALYAALSRTNQLIMRKHDDATGLPESICSICVDTGHARVAAVVLRKDESCEVSACAGPAAGVLKEQPVRVSELRRGSPVDVALRQGRHGIDAGEHSPVPDAFVPASARQVGIRAMAAFPIRRAGSVIGALCLYVEEAGYFDAEIVALLDEMAEDLSFALDNADREAAGIEQRRRAEVGYDNFRRAFDAIPTIALINRMEDARIVEINAAGARLYGFRRDEMLGRRLKELGAGMSDADLARFRARVEQQGSVRDFEAATRVRSGAQRTLLLNGERIDFDAQTCVLTMGVDITELRTAERAEQARRVAEAASNAKSEFLSRMSHELRTPLNAVLGFTQLMEADVHERLSERQRQRIARVREAGGHLLALVNDVLDLSRIEAGRLQLQLQPVPIGALLDSALELCESHAQARAVTLEAAYRGTDTGSVFADQVRLRQVMVNLLSNAIKYNRPGGTVRLDVKAEGKRTLVSVADNGLGMTQEQVHHLFEAFNRLGRERTEIEGTGIGLSVCRHLVQLMHGEIEVQSRFGEGTTVRLSLPSSIVAPLDLQRLGPEVLTAASAAAELSGTVVCIEDNPVNMALLEEAFMRWPDVRFEGAPDGRRGLALTKSLRPDLVLLDMQLPDMDGYQVLHALRADPATRDTCVVVVSASAMPEEIERALGAGAERYWTKPLDFHLFEDELPQLLQGQREAAGKKAHGRNAPAGR